MNFPGDVPFSALLASVMAERGMTDKVLAGLLDVGPNTPNRWKNSRMTPGDEILDRLVKHLGGTEESWARSLRAERRLQRSTVDELRAQVRALAAKAAQLG